MDATDTIVSETVRAKVHKGTKIRILLYCLIFLISVGIVAYHIWEDGSGITLPATALIIGIGLGISLSRIHHITWDHGAKQVISRLDTFGVIILGVYILFAIKRGEVVAYFIHGPAVASASFALLSGIMAGRILGISHKVAKVLNEQDVLDITAE